MSVDSEIIALNSRFDAKRESQTSLTNTFPSGVYPAWLARFASEVTRAVEVPPGITEFVILGMLGAAYGTHLQLALKHGYVRYCHDFFFVIADVSVGKSGLMQYTSAPLRQIQTNLRTHNEEDAPRPQVIISDATPEAMLKVQSGNRGAAAMVSAETPLIGQLSSTGGKEWALQPYLSSHTGEPYQVDRITREQNDVECARLAIVAATQPETLKQAHNRPHLETSGFLARRTFYMCPPMTEADLSPDDPEVSDELQHRYNDTLRERGSATARTARRRFGCAQKLVRLGRLGSHGTGDGIGCPFPRCATWLASVRSSKRRSPAGPGYSMCSGARKKDASPAC